MAGAGGPAGSPSLPLGTGPAAAGAPSPSVPSPHTHGPREDERKARGVAPPRLPLSEKAAGFPRPHGFWGPSRRHHPPPPPVLCPRGGLPGLPPRLPASGRGAGRAGPAAGPSAAVWSFAREQARLKASVVAEDTEEWQKDSSLTGLERVGGVDLSYIKGDDTRACASLVVLSYPALEVLYEDCRMVAVSAPYVPGFLAFREVPFLVEAVQRLQQEEPKLKPQVLLVDGNGLLHPRGFGVACHLGVLTDLPCVGVAKNLLQVDGLVRDELHREQVHSLRREGDTFPLRGASGGVLGMVLRSYNNSSKPLYISVGHRVCLETAVHLVKSCCRLILDRGSIFGSSCVHHWRSYLLGQREKRRLNWTISLMAEETAGLLFTGSSPPPRPVLLSAPAECRPRGEQCKAVPVRTGPGTACGSGGQADRLLLKDNV
ncbi:endonuclease V isoform X2 [Balearica regulorum gibbericeps]|uniref:endonuclease V isoform X2 n=1 Tax=Balearica regulorum gibbericeps TaxID=100784 RepID=UPI003F63BBA1